VLAQRINKKFHHGLSGYVLHLYVFIEYWLYLQQHKVLKLYIKLGKYVWLKSC